MGNFDKSRPIGVVSSFIVNALTSTREAMALWIFSDVGGSIALSRTSSIDDPSFRRRIFIRSARSCSDRRSISGMGWSAS
jgi:hypothetical protein